MSRGIKAFLDHFRGKEMLLQKEWWSMVLKCIPSFVSVLLRVMISLGDSAHRQAPFGRPTRQATQAGTCWVGSNFTGGTKHQENQL